MVSAPGPVPDRGDIVWINLNPQAGRRPALVLSPAAYNRRVGLALVCPVTSQRKGYSFEVRLPDSSPVRGVILSDQVKSLDWRARNAEIVGRLPASVADEALAKLGTLLS